MSAAILSVDDVTHAQDAGPPRFRVTDLRNLGFLPNIDVHGTMGINNKGQVVYAYSASSVYHAWMWLPEAEYGLAANSIHTVDSSGNHSIARDINEAGKIAGVSGGLSGSGSKATVWTPASGAFSSPSLFATGPSAAHGISNDNPPHVVGWRETEDDCGLSTETDEAFLWVVGSSSSALAAVGTFSGEFSNAFDIRRNGDDITVGLSEPCGRVNACIEPFEGTAWIGTSGSIMDFGDVRDGADHRESHPRGINDAGEIVGWVYFDPDDAPVQCFPSAAFWESPADTDPVDLSEFLEDEFDISRAIAINSLAAPQVVGDNQTTEHAVLWEYDGGWTGIDLNRHNPLASDYMIAECSADVWEIRVAHDINDNGWIVAIGAGDLGGGLETHALLLTPVACDGMDVNNDGFVDEYDLAEVFTYAMDPLDCPPATICIWDVNFDCTIDGDDYDRLADYINSCGSPCECVGESFTMGGGLSIERYTLALAALDPELTSEQMAVAWEWFFAVYYSN